jgi:hypothetical protein
MRYTFSLVAVLLFLGVAFAQKPVDRKSITHLNVESDHIVMLRTEVVLNNPTTLLNEVSRAGAFSCVRDRPGADAVACLPRTVAPHPHGRL